MSAATLTPPPVFGVDRSQLKKPGILRLTRVEMRKMVDTRSGFWLLMVIAGLSVLFVTLGIFTGNDEDRKFYTFFQATLFPVSILLPVLGILVVTTEWSQRTALTTFGLVPIRLRVVVAKFLAGIAYAMLSILTSLAAAVIGYGVAVALGQTAVTSWSLPGWAIPSAILFQVLGVISGVAFGMLLMNTPFAIVLFFVLPTALTILGATIHALEKSVAWLDINGATTHLIDTSMNSKDWQHLATASLLWIIGPMILGSLRLVRRELK